jgi:hypothetical protein
VFKPLVCLCAVAAALWVSSALSEEVKKPFSAEIHKRRGLTCIACHKEPKPKTDASPENCLVCHQSIEAVAEKTADRSPNPHKNHVTDSMDLECTQCHHGHKADTPLCLQCHLGMGFEKAATEPERPVS